MEDLAELCLSSQKKMSKDDTNVKSQYRSKYLRLDDVDENFEAVAKQLAMLFLDDNQHEPPTTEQIQNALHDA